jgi:hypothetical protein
MPSKIGQYVISDDELGSGITSVVHEATDAQGKKWAIKIFDRAHP